MDSQTRSAIVFDCDGVLLDSNRMKVDAFAHVLATYAPAIVADFLTYQSNSFGRSRFRLLEDFFRDFLKRSPEGGELEGLIDSFGAYTRQAYLDVPITEGAFEAVETLGRSFDLYIASGSAEDELREVFDKRGLAHYFVSIHGSPRKKQDILVELASRNQLIAMIGDAKADYEAAVVAGAPFVYMSKYTTAAAMMDALHAEAGFECIETLQELPSIVARLENEGEAS